MSELSDRRARKKARTRAEVRQAAQQLFAERGFDAVTIADVAAAADVAVQTVFNHFATKEELFFAERTPWVEGAAASVRDRAPGTEPLAALRDYLVDQVATLAGAYHTPERRSFIATIEASPALGAYERELVHVAERRVAAALEEAWSDGGPSALLTVTHEDVPTAASLISATWLGAARVLLVGHRPVLGTADAGRYAGAVAVRAEQVFDRLAACFHQPAAASVRRVG